MRPLRFAVGARSARRNDVATVLKSFQISFGLIEFGEEILFGLELAGMDAAASIFCFYGMPEVEHLVIHQVFDSEARRVAAVEDAADHDGVVRSVVVPEEATC